jgi:Uncharacterized protein conserved in bacteria
MSCGKCLSDIDLSEGYAKCQGCGNRYHHGDCSVAISTWKAKSEQSKKDWRCASCRSQLKAATGSDDDGATEKSTNSELLKIVNESLQYFCKNNESKVSTIVSDMKQSLKSNISTVNSNLVKFSQDLMAKVNELSLNVAEMKSSQQKLIEENNQLKSELNSVKEKLGTMELKMTMNSSIDNYLPRVQGHQGRRDYSNAVRQHDQQGSVSSQSQAVTSPISPLPMFTPSQQQRVLPTRERGAGSGVFSPRIQLAGNGAAAGQPGGSGGQASGGPGGTGGQSGGRPSAVGSQHGASGGQQTDNQWTTVTRGRRRGNSGNMAVSRNSRIVPKIGTKQGTGAQSLRMATPREPRPRLAALFVSRFDPTTTSQEIQSSLVESSLGLSHLKVNKIKTRLDFYASFHVEVLADDLAKIDNTDAWPEGTLIKPYLGRLIPEIVIHEAPGSSQDS